MTREELNAKNKADLLALATAANLAATPAMTKGDLVELLLANAQLTAATPPAAPIPAPAPAETAAPAGDVAAQMAAMQEQLNKLLAVNAAQAADLDAARAQAAKAAATLETDKLVPDNGVDLPKEGALRSLDGSLAGSSKMRVTVMATESEKEDVKLGVNGHLIIIKRGLPVVIDAAYVEVLRNSTIDTIAQDPETGQKVAVKMQRYPFTAEPA